MNENQKLIEEEIKKAESLLPMGELIIGGSFVEKDNFKDIDFFLVLKDKIFEEHFLEPEQWLTERLTGNWSPGMWKFRDYSFILKKLVEKRLKSIYPIDLWIIPQSYRFNINR